MALTCQGWMHYYWIYFCHCQLWSKTVCGFVRLETSAVDRSWKHMLVTKQWIQQPWNQEMSRHMSWPIIYANFANRTLFQNQHVWPLHETCIDWTLQHVCDAIHKYFQLEVQHRCKFSCHRHIWWHGYHGTYYTTPNLQLSIWVPIQCYNPQGLNWCSTVDWKMINLIEKTIT